jgi:type I restriction enzyme R subunit
VGRCCNKHINEIVDFADAFLNHQHLTQMLTQYMVMLETSKSLMVLRPYQIYAVQKIIAHVQNSHQTAISGTPQVQAKP